MTDRPFVSVIVPVYNDPVGIRRCLEALDDQTYPDNRYEVLVVDNGSTDDTRKVIREFGDMTLLVEDDVQGSYAARNEGIRHAGGDILGFTDEDCTPDSDWIEAGVDTMESQAADLVGGRVIFEFSKKRTAAERFDASVNMRNDESTTHGVAKTANVFVRRSVINDIGLFPSHLPSGGDVHWTELATNAGYTLVYGPEAVVRHPSRQLQELLQKQYRVGKGQVQVWRLADRPAAWILLSRLVVFPLNVAQFVFRRDRENDTPVNETPPDRDVDKTVSVVAVAGLCILAMTLGRIAELMSSS